MSAASLIGEPQAGHARLGVVAGRILEPVVDPLRRGLAAEPLEVGAELAAQILLAGDRARGGADGLLRRLVTRHAAHRRHQLLAPHRIAGQRNRLHVVSRAVGEQIADDGDHFLVAACDGLGIAVVALTEVGRHPGLRPEPGGILDPLERELRGQLVAHAAQARPALGSPGEAGDLVTGVAARLLDQVQPVAELGSATDLGLTAVALEAARLRVA